MVYRDVSCFIINDNRALFKINIKTPNPYLFLPCLFDKAFFLSASGLFGEKLLKFVCHQFKKKP